MRTVLQAVLIATIAVPCVAVANLSAQRQGASDASAAGQRVRVTEQNGEKTIGQLVEVGGETVTLQLAKSGQRRIIPRVGIQSFEVSKGQRTNMVRGMLIGAGAGGLLGAVVGAAAGDSCEQKGPFCTPKGFNAGVTGVAGLVVGALAGTLTGAFVRTEKWTDPVTLPAPTVSFGITSKGIGLRILTR